MLRTGVLFALLPLVAAAADLSGRWEGVAQVPGAPQALVLDLAGGIGSVTLPGRRVSGAPLRDLALGANGLRASLAAAIPSFGGAGAPPAIALERQPDGRLAGQLTLAGLSAPVSLRRTGDAQVQPAPASGAISAALAGTWRGRYQLDGVPREVTLKLQAGPPGPGRVDLLIVGKRANPVPVDRVEQGPVYLVLESSDFGLSIEGRVVGADRIEATLLQGPIEVSFVLTRSTGAGS